MSPSTLVWQTVRGVWKSKFLWTMGLFMVLASPFASAVQFYRSDISSNLTQASLRASDLFKVWLGSHFALALVLGLIAVAVFLLCVVIGIWARGGLIRITWQAIDSTPKKTPGVFATLASGRQFFWPLLGQGVIFGLLAVVLIAVPVLPGLILFALNVKVFGTALALLGIIIAFVAGIAISFADVIASSLLVGTRVQIVSSIKQAWSLVRRTWRTQVIVALLLWLVQIVVTLISTIAIVGAAALFIGLGYVAVSSANTPLLVSSILLFGLSFILISLISQGYLAAVTQVTWTQFTKQIGSR